ncbi:hypothetical protein P9112_012325 [Eukaryota sp. TZLM1-RC]
MSSSNESEIGFSSHSEGEDLDHQYLEDNAAIPELDTYEGAGLDDTTPPPESIAQRRQLEIELHGRQQGQDPYFPDFFLPQRLRQSTEDDFSLDIDEVMRQAEDDSSSIDLTQLRDAVSNLIYSIQVQAEIKRQFKLFLSNFQLPGTRHPHYLSLIHSMAERNECSLRVSFDHLVQFSPATARIAEWFIEVPLDMAPLFDQVLCDLTFQDYPRFKGMSLYPLHVRIGPLPIRDLLRDLRTIHLNKLVCVDGVVTRRSAVFPKLTLVVWVCNECQLKTEPIDILNEGDAEAPEFCPGCDRKTQHKISKTESKYTSYQRVDLQESPKSVEAGRAPRSMTCVFSDDLIDSVRPGQEISVTGTFVAEVEKLNKRGGFPVCPTVIKALAVEDLSGSVLLDDLTQEDIANIKALSREPDIANRIFKSIAPDIYGLDHIKEVLALTLFGGVEKKSERHRSRGDINVILLGDPSTAKSQFLKFLEKTAPRAVFTTGKGASAVGLTACVRRDPQTKLMTLEGGAFVIADRGMCLIDEFDKMSEFDRSAIHEAMEQQTVSVSKAGIVASLNSRCSVVACANPIGGKYDVGRPLLSNVNLSEPILSRFDVPIVLRDLVDPFIDTETAHFVVESHAKLHPDNQEQIEEEVREGAIPHELLKKYVRFAKKECVPQLGSLIKPQQLEELYSLLRRESAAHGGQVITVRQLESIIRLAEASARLHLRREVNLNDIKRSIRIVVSSFIETQKISVRKHLQKVFQKYLTEASQTTRNSNDVSVLYEQLDSILARTLRDRYSYLDASRQLPPDLSGSLHISISLADFENALKQEGMDVYVSDGSGAGESIFRGYLKEIRRRPRKNIQFDGSVFTRMF